MPIPDAYQKVPLMFRAQVRGRSQLQYLDPQRRRNNEMQDVEMWADEWIDKAEFIPKSQTEDVQTDTYGAKSYEISWRFVTNGGQDDGLVRPVMGGRGIPFYPGSSMKGAFRAAAQQMEAAGDLAQGRCDRYCGDEEDLGPGILRFHGAYPTNDWTEGLLDLIHPQQGWQVKTQETHRKPSGESAYAQVSLYQPTMRFMLSSIVALNDAEWAEIWQIWETAIAAGLGSKVSTGYGYPTGKPSRTIVFRARLIGQGQAAKRLDDEGEFRPNIFRAALRGHALRIFGGLTSADIAESLVDDLFGGIQRREPTVGLLGFQFRTRELELDSFGAGKYAQPTYDVEGDLAWMLMRPLPNPEHLPALRKLVGKLMQMAMVLGGFGKSWRRVDHRLFFDDYYEDQYKALIGCHWQWGDNPSKRRNRQVASINKLGGFLDQVRAAAQEWMQLQNQPLQGNNWATNWRESFHPSRVQVWARVAEMVDDSAAVLWFHQNYRENQSIKKSTVTGKIGRIGRIWHRMYPVIILQKNPDDPKKPIVRRTPRYLEILTLFPDSSDEFEQFIEFLKTHPDEFEQVWGDR
jgi:CRISPR-associated protein Cmr6